VWYGVWRDCEAIPLCTATMLYWPANYCRTAPPIQLCTIFKMYTIGFLRDIYVTRESLQEVMVGRLSYRAGIKYLNATLAC
jgi:hypothetical protein